MKLKEKEMESSNAEPEVVRDAQWFAAFDHQVTPGLRRRALNVARWYVHKVEMSGGLVASSLAEDLVADAIADTWLGRLSWNPAKKTLMEHIASTIEWRTRKQRKKAKKSPVASLDACEDDENDDRVAALWIEAERALAASACATNTGELVCVLVDVFERVRALAAGDFEVLTLLDAMQAGAVDRADLIHVTGMSVRRYESARRRLDTLLRKLPADVLRLASAVRPPVSAPRAA